MIRYVLKLLLILFLFSTLEAKESLKEVPSNKKVALLFLTYSDLNHSSFWKEYLEPHLDKFNIYIHPKNPITDPFFAQFCLSAHYETTWANTIVAEKGLLLEAFANADNYKLVLLSNSCLPLVNATLLYQTLIRDDLSYFYWTQRGWWDVNDPREVTKLPFEHRTGNNQWFTLNRRHAELCVQDDYILSLVSQHFIDNESYPSCLFSVHGCLEEVINFGYTFDDWSRPENGAHPYTFRTTNAFDFSLLIQAKSKGHLFARKFASEYPLKDLQAIIE